MDEASTLLSFQQGWVVAHHLVLNSRESPITSKNLSQCNTTENSGLSISAEQNILYFPLQGTVQFSSAQLFHASFSSADSISSL